MSMIAAVIGRLLIALMFLASGLSKIVDPEPTAQMLASTNLPAGLAIPAGVFEVVAALLLAVGLMTRLVSIVLAGFVALTIFFFHHDFAHPTGLGEALSHGALIGGLLMTFAYGQMRGSYDHLRMERRLQKAELRAAHAEGQAEAAATTHTAIARD